MAFTPLQSFTGGALIGLAAALNAVLNGRVTGISGYARRALQLDGGAMLFMLGLFLVGLRTGPGSHADADDALRTLSVARLAGAGFLVGVGTRLANGCTSGHGVCGISRASPRGMIATVIYMSIAMAVATAFHSARNVPDLAKGRVPRPRAKGPTLALEITVLVCLMLALVYSANSSAAPHVREIVSQFFVAVCFGTGLVVSGMNSPAKVLNFLDLSSPNWDASLLFVFAGALPVAAAGFLSLDAVQKPLLTATAMIPKRRDIDVKLALGSAVFGLGWGMLGFCPGPAFVYWGRTYRAISIYLFLVAFVLGDFVTTIPGNFESLAALSADFGCAVAP